MPGKTRVTAVAVTLILSAALSLLAFAQRPPDQEALAKDPVLFLHELGVKPEPKR
jgi:hypothetical protein